MTLGITIALAYTCAAANGCTFCTLHETSKFESDCKAQGGQVRTFAASQTCVLGSRTSQRAIVVDDDAGD